MREILFRGKKFDKKEWVEGFYANSYDRAYIITMSFERIYTSDEIFPETLGQYTGLKDKNGKRIFDGDIVRYIYEPGKGFWNANQLSVIRWDEAGYKLDGIFGTNKYACMSGFLCTIPFNQEETYIPEFEVVGNIHDNPELLRTNGW